jgi:hypothetical protein
VVWFHVRVQNCLVTTYHFQAPSYFCNQNTFNLLGLTSLNFAYWSLIKIFCQNTLWKKHLLISKQQENKGKTCFVQGWDVTPTQNAKWQKSITKMIDNSNPYWISYSSNICVLPNNFNHLSFWGCSMTVWPMTSSFRNSICLLFTILSTQFLKFLQLFNWMAWSPPMIFKSLVWIIPPRK